MGEDALYEHGQYRRTEHCRCAAVASLMEAGGESFIGAIGMYYLVIAI